MSDRRTAAAARMAALVLAVLCLSSLVSTVGLVRYAAAERSAVAAGWAVVPALVTAALGWGAVRMWRR